MFRDESVNEYQAIAEVRDRASVLVVRDRRLLSEVCLLGMIEVGCLEILVSLKAAVVGWEETGRSILDGIP